VAEAKISKKDSEVTLTITIPAKKVKEVFSGIKEKAIKQVKVPGFREGKVPKDVAEKHLNEETLAQSLFQELIPIAYAQAITKEGIKPVIPPQITVKEYKKDKELVFEAKTAEVPSVSLGDYKKALKSLKPKVIYGPEGKPLREEGEITAAQILEELRGTAKVSVPHILVDYEVQRMLSSLIDQVRSLGLSMDQYLSSQGKNAEGIRKEYHDTAERNLKDEFVLTEIAKKEKINVEAKEIDEAIDATPDEKVKANLGSQQGRAYLEDVLRKRKTVEHLLKLAKGKS
jgi:FKBP-type peptidyl-prolyl cis-trans isomerase (trigger factor)